MLDKFREYVSNYDLNNNDILSKYNHSIRVMKLMIKYAEKLNYTEEEKEICQIVGLLHDIGRFLQLKVFKTYIDYKSVDHDDYSVEQLFKKGDINSSSASEYKKVTHTDAYFTQYGYDTAGMEEWREDEDKRV